jgi:hypothetical protein
VLIEVNARWHAAWPDSAERPRSAGLELLQIFTHQTLGAIRVRPVSNSRSDARCAGPSRTENSIGAARCEYQTPPRESGGLGEAEAGNARPITMLKRRGWVVRAVGALSLAGLAGNAPGCGTGPGAWRAPSVTKIFSPAPVAPNPLVVPSGDFENVWNKTVAVVDKYFDIESENRLSHIIRTQPQSGATILEPWAPDAVSFQDRVEGSFQTLRRTAVIHVDPAPSGGFLVKVEVLKFLEDMAKPDRQAAGRAVFNNDFPVNRTREIVGPVPAPLGWILRGRDGNLEQAILAGIRDALFL